MSDDEMVKRLLDWFDQTQGALNSIALEAAKQTEWTERIHQSLDRIAQHPSLPPK